MDENRSMTLKNYFHTYIEYLIHPFKTHESFLMDDGRVDKITAYESLTFSWVFVIFNGIVRIAFISLILFLVSNFIESSSFDLAGLVDLSNLNQFYFLIFSVSLDLIFYPLFGFFLIQFWEVMLGFYARRLRVKGDIEEKANLILSVSMSSYMLRVIPVLGSMGQTISSLIAMYAGLRVQFKASPALCVCILLTPLLVMLGTICFIIFLFSFL